MPQDTQQLYSGWERIQLDKIDIPTVNVRRREITADLTELAASLNKHGLQQPIVVMPKGDRYSVAVGQRRYLAARYLNWPDIDALILKTTLDPTQATLFSFSENIQRKDLSSRDKSEACTSLMSALGSIGAVADALGISTQTVRRWLGFAEVPEAIKALVRPGRLTVSQATQIWNTIDDEAVAIAVAERVAGEPVKDNRTRILASAKQLRGRSANAIFQRAEELGEISHIQFDLTQVESRAMAEATDQTGSEADDLAKLATVDWLEENRYLRT